MQKLLKITNSHLSCWHSWPWTIIIAAHSDSLACTMCTEPAQCTYKEKKQRKGFIYTHPRTHKSTHPRTHTREACVSTNANTIPSLWRKNKSSLSKININTNKQNTSMTDDADCKGLLNNAWCVLPELLPCLIVHNGGAYAHTARVLAYPGSRFLSFRG